MSSRNFVKIANKYISDVLSGKISACKYVKQACKRQLKDLERSDWQFVFDEDKASKICKFIELLHHVKGPKAGENITLEPWQIFILTTIFGWVKKDTGTRRFTRVYIEVPRGNGKSTLLSGIGLYMETADGEKGADIYSFATTRDQAKIVFGDAQAMARGNKKLLQAYGMTVLAHSIVVLGTNSKFEAKSADADSLDGLNTHCGIIDELHAHKTRAVFDVVETSIGKRDQPLMICITTAGFILNGICMEQRQYIAQLLDGSADGDSQFGIIYSIDEGDDWRDEESLIKANPNWGVSVNPDEIHATLAKALANPRSENNFKTKHLDVWCNADSAFMQMSKWRRAFRPKVELKEFEGYPCIYALDLAAKTDIAALIRIFWRTEDDKKLHFYHFPEFWLPSERVNDSKNTQYDGWAKQGLIHVTDGEINDFTAIQDYIADDAQHYDTLAVAFDPWQAYQLAANLADQGLPMVEIKPTVQNFSEPMKEMQALTYQELLHSDGNPIMDWMVSNVVAHTDAKDNIYPRKTNPENKIDGVVALIMAIKQAMFLQVEEYYNYTPKKAKKKLDLFF